MHRLSINLLLVVAFALLGCGKQYSGKKQPLAKKGVLDLRGWNFEKDGPVKLNGELTAVFFEGERVLGGGRIERALVSSKQSLG